MSNSKFPIDLALTDVSVAYKNGDLIADRISPIVGVPRSSGHYWEWGRADTVRRGTALRPNGGESTRVKFSASKKAFATEEYAFHIGITEKDRADSDPSLDIETSETEALTRLLLTDREFRVADFFRATANYEAGLSETFSGTSQWNDAGYAGDPLKQIDERREEVRKACGYYPNVLVLCPEGAVALGNNANFRDHYKYTKDDVANGNPLPPVIRGMTVVISNAQGAVGNEGNDTLSDIWGKDMIMAYINPNGKVKEVSFSYTLRRKQLVGTNAYGIVTRKWDDIDTKTTKIEVETDEVIQSIAKGAGFLIKDIVA